MPRKPAGLPPHQQHRGPRRRPGSGLRPTSFRKGAASGGISPRARRGEPDGCPCGGVSVGPPPLQPRFTAHPDRARCGHRLPGGARPLPAAPGLARGTQSRSVPAGRGARRGPRGTRRTGGPAAAPVPSRRPEEARSGPAADTVWRKGPGTRDSDGTYIYVPTSLKIHIPYFKLTNTAKLKW